MAKKSKEKKYPAKDNLAFFADSIGKVQISQRQDREEIAQRTRHTATRRQKKEVGRDQRKDQCANRAFFAAFEERLCQHASLNDAHPIAAWCKPANQVDALEAR